MMVMESDLLYINDVAKTLKQKNFVWYQNKLFNVFNNNQIIETTLDNSKLSYFPSRAIKINQTELRDFCKGLVLSTIEIENIPEYGNANIELTNPPYDNLVLEVNGELDIKTNHMISIINNINSQIVDNPIDITKIIQPLYKASKKTGSEKYIIDNHIMYLSSTSLPLKSNSKVYLNILDHDITFISKFTIKNSINIINVYLNFLKL